ncbi:hypothetical protein SUGI_0485820 [Cryptomeria japonica]|uniref:uncharacterized protein LOC131028846 n=1 Tax=Cryptomeria japonica TaxID=3369 RepID=UPI002408E723|nr:uncharacterized protein LOC131028846 [Cryptomeria japonica]GLJ25378.1 hypothetical protein SUGI_0485820 [Cryptomeria japonica]
MQIKLKCNCSKEDCMEWAILELQGTIDVQLAFRNKLQNLQIGSLCRSSKQDNYFFTVGYHELEGKKVPLKKPLLVLRKQKEVDMRDVDANFNIPEVKRSIVEYEVIGIIKQKILFKTRPKALISKPEVKEKKITPLDASAS